MKIQAFGCTHGFHSNLVVEEGIDMLIHTGDSTNYKDPMYNHGEMLNFLDWYEAQNVKHKILVAGNHDTSIEKRLVTPGDIAARGIVYLENAGTIIEGLNIWGNPFTPTFGNWSFMKARDKMHNLWNHMPDNTDIIISHGPPAFTLDLTENRDGSLESCGDLSLLKHCWRVQPKHVFFSHIHNCKNIRNRGTKTEDNIHYHNVSCVEDGRFDKGLQSSGIIINI